MGEFTQLCHGLKLRKKTNLPFCIENYYYLSTDCIIHEISNHPYENSVCFLEVYFKPEFGLQKVSFYGFFKLVFGADDEVYFLDLEVKTFPHNNPLTKEHYGAIHYLLRSRDILLPTSVKKHIYLIMENMLI